jgi:hypothetical protein
MGFQRVQRILDNAVATWEQEHEHSADLAGHGASFSWKTKSNLLAAEGHGKRLIQPEVIGNGQGSTANLVVVLRTGLPWRMPNEGCPE